MTKPLVLIVEDEAPLVTMLRYNLEREGFQVCEAGDGEEALVQIAERRPDLVLLDWMLPLVSGIEVSQVRTWYLGGQRPLNNHYDLYLGYLF